LKISIDKMHIKQIVNNSLDMHFKGNRPEAFVDVDQPREGGD